MSERVYIFDTTLRDGEQAPGVALNRREKLRLARKLASLNVDVLEAGFPAASQGDFDSVQEIAEKVREPVICALARNREEDILKAWEAVRHAQRPRIHIFVATSDIHLKYKFKLTREQLLERLAKLLPMAVDLCPNIQFSAEDSSRSDRGFLREVVNLALDNKIQIINLADTVGYSLPWNMYDLVSNLFNDVPRLKNVLVGVHCHDDLGMATANTLMGIKAGARQVDVCVNGIGERAGNASLEEVVMAIEVHKAAWNIHTAINKKEIYSASRLVSLATGLSVQSNKAVVGANAFTHESGIHVAAMLRKAQTYEIIDPQEVGAGRGALVLGKHSGRAGFKAKLEEMGHFLSEEDIDRLFSAFKALADKKKEIFAEDLEVLIADEIIQMPERWRLDYLNVNSGTVTVPTATVRLWEGDELRQGFGSGVGPVDALYNTIAQMTGSKASLLDFAMSSVSGGMDAQAEVMVRLSEENYLVAGKGADQDIMVASAKAYLNALNHLDHIKTLPRRIPAQGANGGLG